MGCSFHFFAKDGVVILFVCLGHKATSVVLFNGSKGDWFRTTVGVRQGCLLSTTSFNIFVERIMKALPALEAEQLITNFRFADDIDGLAGEEEELANLAERLDKASTAYGIEINAKKPS